MRASACALSECQCIKRGVIARSVQSREKVASMRWGGSDTRLSSQTATLKGSERETEREREREREWRV